MITLFASLECSKPALRGDSNRCPPDQELGAPSKGLASQFSFYGSRQASSKEFPLEPNKWGSARRFDKSV